MEETQSPSGPLAHHYDTPNQQFESAKLGMWLFLATEVLLFGGLFVAYAVLRNSNPEMFSYGARYLDSNWGAINTVVLILSSAFMATAVWCAQTNRRRELVIFLALTLLCAVDFLGVKFIEYHHKFHENFVWGEGFYEDPTPVADNVAEEKTESTERAPREPGDPDKGRGLYRNTCAACHGISGQGLTGLGKPLKSSKFLAELSPDETLEFLIAGRPASDPLNTTGVAMMPRGGNLSLTDQHLTDIASYVETLQSMADLRSAADISAELKLERELKSKTTVAQAETAPAGLVAMSAKVVDEVKDPRNDKNSPPLMHKFFGLYFLMTGLHGIHVVGGVFLIGWLLIRSAKGHFSRRYFTPVDLGALYWHLVDLIWIFLFPLFYLI